MAAAALLICACTAPAPVPTASTNASPSATASVPSTAPATPAAPGPTSTPTPVATPSSAPSPSPSAALPDGSVIVTFAVGSEQFKALLTTPANIAIAEALLAGEEAPPIPNGRIVYGEPGVNAPWSWHLDPDSIEFADVTVEVCDGLPSHVEGHTLTSDRFCPWSAEVVAVEPAAE